MDTTKLIKKLVIVELLLFIAVTLLPFQLTSYLPELLQNYVLVASSKELSTLDIVLYSLLSLVLAVYLVSIIGLLLTKSWAKNIYIAISVIGFILLPFMGPTVMHGVTATLHDTGNFITGVIMTLLIFTPSKFSR